MSKPTWEQAITDGPCGNLSEPYQKHWDSIASGIAHVFFASDEDYDNAFGRELTDDDFDRISEFDWQRQKKVTAIAFFELLRLVAEEREACARIAETPSATTYECTVVVGDCKSTFQQQLPKHDFEIAKEIRARNDK